MSAEGHQIKIILELLEAFEKSTTGDLPQEILDCIRMHGAIAVGASVAPIPGAATIGSAANVWTMYARINRKIGIELSNNILKSVASGIIANLGSYAVLLTIGEGLKFLPGVGTLVGAAIDAAILYALTVTSACIYIKALTAMAKKKLISEEALGPEVERVLSEDKEEIKAIMREAKKSYKK